MKHIVLLLGWMLLVAAAPLPHWQPAQVEQLATWLASADDDALAPVAAEAPAVRAALARGNSAEIDSVATAAALRLLHAYRYGCCVAVPHADWHIGDSGAYVDPTAQLTAAVASDRIDALFKAARPSQPYYLGLREAYAHEADPEKRQIIAANLDRWRSMPHNLGTRYLLVNEAAFEVSLWQDGAVAGQWKAVVGKDKLQTPVFEATVTGVNFNPWWEIPESIVAESVGKMMRTNPKKAAAKGYVILDGRYRERPGPENSLGRMKLVMPNPYNIYLHDTPAQSLFKKNVRTFSHGCIRVADALDFATTLLAPVPGWDRAKTDATVAAGETVTVPLAAHIPVYVTYFTAEPDGQGGARYFADVYHRDPPPLAAAGPQTPAKK